MRVGDSNATIANRAEFVDWTGTDARTKVARYDGLDHPTVTHFNFAGRPLLVQHAGADPNDEPTSSSPNKSLWVYRKYDSLFQVTDVYDGDGGRTKLAWDAGGRLIERELMTRPAWLSTYQVKDRLVRGKLGRVTLTVTWSASGSNALKVQSGYSGEDPFQIRSGRR